VSILGNYTIIKSEFFLGKIWGIVEKVGEKFHRISFV